MENTYVIIWVKKVYGRSSVQASSIKEAAEKADSESEDFEEIGYYPPDEREPEWEIEKIELESL